MNESQEPDGVSTSPISEVPTTRLAEDLPNTKAEFGKTEIAQDNPEKDPLLGLQLGNYHIISCLGRGGFGAVYGARDTHLARNAALKFLRSPEDRKIRAMFEQEAKAIAALGSHPNIVQIYAWGEYKDRNYFALEFIAGGADKLLGEAPDGLDWQEVVRIGAECAKGLAYAHSQGILHRDVKPANILIDPATGHVKIADFGLAKVAGATVQSVSGSVSGSPPYMSPEQALSKRVDARSDIFSLGVTMYQLLTNRLPFTGRTSLEVLRNIVDNRRIPLRDRAGHLPEPVIAVVERAMAHDANQRFASAAELVATLEALPNVIENATAHAPSRVPDPLATGYAPLRPDSAPLPPSTAPRRNLVPALLAALAMLSLIVGAWYFVQRHPGLTAANPALAEARNAFNLGDAEAAVPTLATYLSQNPQDDRARSWSVLAELRRGNIAAAEAALNQMHDDSLGAEATAAVEYEKGGASARTRVEELATKAGTAYAKLLAALPLLAAGDYKAANERLASLGAQTFDFEWQRVQCLQSRGEALYRLGNYGEAERVFGELASSRIPSAAVFAGAYLGMLKDQRDEKKRADIAEQIREVRELIEKAPAPPAPSDNWTSRPLVACVLPPSAGKSAIAMESGLADVLPSMLAKAIQGKGPISIVDRSLLDAVLQEQELSAQLGSDTDRIRLGRLLSARLLIQCDFSTLFGKQSASAMIVDTESTTKVTSGAQPLTRATDPDEWFDRFATEIWGIIGKNYPLRGKLTNGPGGPEINIGTKVGVQAAMRFAVSASPTPRSAQPGWAASVTGTVEAERASVTLSGLESAAIPPEGLYVYLEDERETNGKHVAAS